MEPAATSPVTSSVLAEITYPSHTFGNSDLGDAREQYPGENLSPTASMAAWPYRRAPLFIVVKIIAAAPGRFNIVFDACI